MEKYILGFNIVLALGALGWVFSDPKNFEPYLFLGTLLIALFPTYNFYYRTRELQKASCTKLSIAELKRRFPKLKRISLVGRSGVGKTTLIENICRKKNQNLITQGTGAYIFNFSNNKNQYVALLDTRGQSPSMLNDIALEAEILLVMLDHNEDSFSQDVSPERLNIHESYLDVLIDRVKTKNHTYKWIHLILNKKDLWEKSESEKAHLEKWGTKQYERLKSEFYPMEISFSFHSNSITSDCTELINLTSQRL